MKVSGIYKIINKTNGKYYVGSSIRIHQRWANHKNELKRNVHTNNHLQRAWNKNGKHNFDFVLVETVDPQNLMGVEQKYLNIAKTEQDKSYNNTFDAFVPGRGITEEVRKRMSESARRRAKTTEGILHLSNAGKVIKIFTAQHKENVSKAKKGQGIDKTIYQWYNTKTNEKLAGTMFDWYSKHCRAKAKYKWAKRLVSGERPTYRSWVILQKDLTDGPADALQMKPSLDGLENVSVKQATDVHFDLIFCGHILSFVLLKQYTALFSRRQVIIATFYDR